MICVACKAKGQDWRFRNGPRKQKLVPTKLYRFYQENTAQVSLCHCHNYELFVLGERRFLEGNPGLVKEMIVHKENYVVRSPVSSF